MPTVYFVVLAFFCCHLQSAYSQQVDPAGSPSKPPSSNEIRANPTHKPLAVPDKEPRPVDPSTGGGCMGGGTCSDDLKSK